jgi:aminoglycoside phosphotransferase (APT) family kinase protein
MNVVFSDEHFYDKVARLMGCAVRDLEFPGGASRNTIRVLLEDGRSCYATGRPKKTRSTRELQILWALDRANVPAPKVLGVEDSFFLQSDVGSDRLSIALAQGDDTQRMKLMRGAVTALVQAQRALAQGDAQGYFDPGNTSHSANLYRAGQPREAAKYLRMQSLPDYDREALARLIALRDDAAVKGDTRPANAIMQPDGQAVWIDWDRAQRGNCLDDLVNLVCDEYCEISLQQEQALFDEFAPQLAPDWSDADRRSYYSAMSVLRCFHRLSLIFEKYAAGGQWWDAQSCLRKDSIGVAPVYVRKLCARGRYWAETSEHLSAVAPVLDVIEAQTG